jgi:hypothetical protein
MVPVSFAVSHWPSIGVAVEVAVPVGRGELDGDVDAEALPVVGAEPDVAQPATSRARAMATPAEPATRGVQDRVMGLSHHGKRSPARWTRRSGAALSAGRRSLAGWTA